MPQLRGSQFSKRLKMIFTVKNHPYTGRIEFFDPFLNGLYRLHDSSVHRKLGILVVEIILDSRLRGNDKAIAKIKS